MVDVTRADIEQLKRDLYSYGFYTSKIKQTQQKMDDLRILLNDRQEVQGISYDNVQGTSDPYHPSTVALIHEEESLFIEKQNYVAKQSALKIDEMMMVLNDKEKTVIECVFFYKNSYRYISSMLGYSHQALHKKTNIAIIKMLRSKK